MSTRIPTRSILITPEELRIFLKENYKGFHTRHYELLIGLNLAMIGESESGVKHLIALPIKHDTERNIPPERTNQNIATALENYLEEATSIDLILVPETHIRTNSSIKIGSATGRAYQLKRYAFNKEAGDITNDLVDYLSNRIPAKYSLQFKTDLVMVIGGGLGGGCFDFEGVAQALSMEKYPFEHILFVTGDDEFLHVGEFWPNPSSKKYAFEV